MKGTNTGPPRAKGTRGRSPPAAAELSASSPAAAIAAAGSFDLVPMGFGANTLSETWPTC
jgi:hypothetical protein